MRDHGKPVSDNDKTLSVVRPLFRISSLLLLVAVTAVVSADLQRLGNPLADKTEYARTVWDLQLFEGRIYIGGGSTLTNAGPMRIQAYNPANGRFETDRMAEGGELLYEESIDLYRVFDGKLYLPAADPREPQNTDRSKYYLKTDAGWVRFASAATLATAHIRDLYRFDDGLLVAVGNSRGIEPGDGFAPGAVFSSDGGVSFRAAIEVGDVSARSGVLFSLFRYRGELLTTTTYFNPSPAVTQPGVYRYDRILNTFKADPAYVTADFLPTQVGFDERVILQPWLPLVYQGALVYPVKARLIYPSGGGLIEVEQFRQGFGLFVKRDFNTPPQVVQLPDRQAIGEDLVIAEGWLYTLANRRLAGGGYQSYLYRTNNPTGDWQEVLRFSGANVAKSLEIYRGYAYFGLGREADEPLADAGMLLRAVLPDTVLQNDGFEAR